MQCKTNITLIKKVVNRIKNIDWIVNSRGHD